MKPTRYSYAEMLELLADGRKHNVWTEKTLHGWDKDLDNHDVIRFEVYTVWYREPYDWDYITQLRAEGRAPKIEVLSVYGVDRSYPIVKPYPTDLIAFMADMKILNMTYEDITKRIMYLKLQDYILRYPQIISLPRQ